MQEINDNIMRNDSFGLMGSEVRKMDSFGLMNSNEMQKSSDKRSSNLFKTANDGNISSNEMNSE